MSTPTLGLGYFLEDLSGSISSTTFEELYQETSSITIAPLKNLPECRAILQISIDEERLAILDFSAPKYPTGIIKFTHGKSAPVDEWLQRRKTKGTSMFSRSFRASNGLVYTWTYQEKRKIGAPPFQCTDSDGKSVANYLVLDSVVMNRPQGGAVMFIEDECTPISLELVTTLTIMRWIAKYHR